MTIDCSLDWPDIRHIAGPCVRPGGPVLTERALEICNLSPGARVVDIGCGAGGTLEHLERTGTYRAFGLDYSETLLREVVPRLARRRLVRGRAEALPFKKGSFDALFCECVLSILGERTAALCEFARVLKEEGFLIVSDVFRRGAPGEGQAHTMSQGPWTEGLLVEEELLSFLTGLGFSLLLWEEHERSLREFAARMILAGVRLPDPWGCSSVGRKADRAGISYFLLVALKVGAVLSAKGKERIG